MGKALISLSLGLSFLFLFHGCLAQLEQSQQQFFWQGMQTQHRLRAKTDCNIHKLTAHEPKHRFQSEAGITEFWGASAHELECAGIEFVRSVVQPKGLVLPYFTNAPELAYIVEGSGILGTVIPGCAETYESESGSSSRYSASEGEEGRRGDRHQKLRRFRRGDVLALQQGITTFFYNDGDSPLTFVSILDVGNDNNQLDLKFRKFFLAGNPQSIQSEGGKRFESSRGRGGKRGEEERRESSSNIFGGFDEELIAEALNIEPELMRKVQGREDDRGVIVRAEKLRMLLPEYGSEEREEGSRGRGYNGFEETFCSLKIRQNIDTPSSADTYNPRGGRISSVNSQTLPILSYLRLSAQRGVLYKNAIAAPQWSTNAHSAMYVTRGSARVQVVGTHGDSVFDGEVREGQLLVIPQNFVAVKKASEEGFEWIAFKTNENAMNGHLAGRLSAIRAMPNEVLMNSFGISREDARSLKYGREETTLFSPSHRSGSYHHA